jgi:hypothetical protein
MHRLLATPLLLYISIVAFASLRATLPLAVLGMRDRDQIFGEEFRRRIKRLTIGPQRHALKPYCRRKKMTYWLLFELETARSIPPRRCQRNHGTKIPSTLLISSKGRFWTALLTNCSAAGCCGGCDRLDCRICTRLFLSKRRHRIDARRSPGGSNTGYQRDGGKQNRHSGQRQGIDGICRKEHRLNESGQANRPA